MTPSGGPVALVTGAAGGVGAAVTELLSARGYDVLACDISPGVGDLDRTAARGSVRSLVGDVASSDTARAAVARAEREFGGLDLLVNNAARFLRRPIAESTDEDFDRLLATNVRGAFVHVRESLRLLRARRGSVVNVASTAGLVGMPGQSVYAITKGALVQLTRQLAIELAPAGVRVNAVAPGAIDTDFVARSGAVETDPARAAMPTAARYPLGRISTPTEVAEAIGFLASPAAGGITGAVLSVDGGYVAQ